jgi:hypothetical protein
MILKKKIGSMSGILPQTIVSTVDYTDYMNVTHHYHATEKKK